MAKTRTIIFVANCLTIVNGAVDHVKLLCLGVVLLLVSFATGVLEEISLKALLAGENETWQQ